MNQVKIYTNAIRRFLELEVMQRAQNALIEHKEKTGMSDEQILRDIDRVLLQSNVKVYTPCAVTLAAGKSKSCVQKCKGHAAL